MTIGALLLAVVLVAPGALALPEPGVVLEDVDRGETGDELDLRPGDVLLSWAQEGRDGALREGAIESPFDLEEMEALRCPRGALVLRGLREGQPFEAWVEPEWCILRQGAAPRLPPELRTVYRDVQGLSRAGRRAEAAAGWAGLADRLAPASAARCWLLARAGSERFKEREHAAARELAAAAVRCAQDAAPAAIPQLLEQEGIDLRDSGEREAAQQTLSRAIELRSRPGGDPLGRALGLWNLSWVDPRPGAPPDQTEVLAVVEREAPASPLLVRLLTTELGARVNDERARADEWALRLEAIFALRGRDHPAAVRAESVMAMLLRGRGQDQEAEQIARRTVQWFRGRGIASADAAAAEVNLAATLRDRGDLQAGEEHLRHAEFLAEKFGARPGMRNVIASIRGSILRELGDLPGALALHARVVEGFRKLNPRSGSYAQALGLLAVTTLEAGDVPAARAGFERALEIGSVGPPGSLFVTETHLHLAKLERSQGRWAEAEGHYRRAMESVAARGVDSVAQAEAYNGLAATIARRGETSEALTLSAKAVAILDRMRDGIAPSPDARALFASAFYGIYRDHVQWLVEQGRSAEAFEVLERGRARSLLALMAERDLRVQDDLPDALEKDRRASHREYEHAQSTLASLGADAPAAEVERWRLHLEHSRQRMVDIADTVRRTSPRAAEVRLPEALGAAAIAASLKPGTVLLSYSVGAEGTVAIALRQGESSTAPPLVRAVVIPIGERALRARADAFRSDAERTAPSASFRGEARALHDLLLSPLGAEIAGARRLIVSADGPLHALPFTALRGPRGYLVERMPVQMVLSGTVYAQLASRRRPVPRNPRLVVFGDPSAAGAGRLPGSRVEVRSIEALFPGSTVHVGTEATERRVKEIGREADYIHFALHGVVDERSPLDSALLLAEAGDENGRLQAWEIFESVRLDAELVVLSACRSAAGAERAGEGTIGLTRAFQFAGARTVVATLWDAGDRSSARFMARFYRALGAGASKADALRAAQVAAIRAGEHPVRWAGFQSYGD
ncbi:MAG: CHAT domain-containing tetratricopeptide repeat protein [Vicinamibacteria bacterium]